ncbi:hypothetical protein PSP6_640021 [Paraburkholderia tropica]|nr:hypothetical protein PSP6_640021 [Paraburkholderia tropica]
MRNEHWPMRFKTLSIFPGCRGAWRLMSIRCTAARSRCSTRRAKRLRVSLMWMRRGSDAERVNLPQTIACNEASHPRLARVRGHAPLSRRGACLMRYAAACANSRRAV